MQQGRTILSEAEFLIHLRHFCEGLGSQTRAAHTLGISQAFLSDVLKNRRTPGAKIPRALGMEKRIMYIPCEEALHDH